MKSVNNPWFAFGTIVLFVVSLVVLIVTGHANDSTVFIGFVISTLPSLVAASFAERASRDIRNHVVQQKAREGAEQALAAIDLPVTPTESRKAVRDVLNESVDDDGHRSG